MFIVVRILRCTRRSRACKTKVSPTMLHAVIVLALTILVVLQQI